MAMNLGDELMGVLRSSISWTFVRHTWFFDTTWPLSLYSINFSDQFQTSVEDVGGSVGVGYEFRENWMIRGDLSFGTHDFNVSNRSVEAVLLIFGFGTPYTEYAGEVTAFSLGLTVNYIWY